MKQEKKVIGPIEHLKVCENNLTYRSRIDTGASRTSLHAVNIEVEDPETNNNENIGKWVTFTTKNDAGQVVDMREVISGVVNLRNSMGASTRYTIPLSISWHGSVHSVHAVLADRTDMSCNLLIGRDWLSGTYIVDVDYPDEY